jgi:prepilin-type N-terminal cleavage/methylation domain-containing protein
MRLGFRSIRRGAVMIASRRSVRYGFTLIELLIVIAIIGILVALIMPALAKAKCVAKNGGASATIADLTRAMECYDADFGIYPCDPAWGTSGKVADTKVFVKLLRSKGPRYTSYYNFRDEDLVGGEYITPFEGRPYKYTFPAYQTNKGPDGQFHAEMPYLLWSFGCLQGPPENDYENNNWGR